MEWTGGCLCGAVRYRAKTDPFWTGHCHCKMCQPWTGSAAFTGAFFAPGQLEWTHGKPSCSSLGFHRDEHHDGVTAGTLDTPEKINPEVHMFAEHEHAWAKIEDGLPRQEGFLPEDEDFDEPDLH